MLEELYDEITSINSIYGDDTLQTISDEPKILALALPSQPSVALRVEFPEGYPNVPPSILGTQSVGNDASKGDGTYLADLLRNVLSEVFTPGAPCIFDLIEDVGSRLQGLEINQSTSDSEQQIAQSDSHRGGDVVDDQSGSHDQEQFHPIYDAAPWSISEVVTEKKSVFIARCAPVISVDQAQRYLKHLLGTDKKVAKATHNITAWRIRNEETGVQYQDCDDDGETAAGSRVLHLLELMGVWNAMVVVTRWYGGVHLGPDRFRIINQCARDAVIKAGFAKEGSEGKGKRKGKS